MKSTISDLKKIYLKNGSARFRVVVEHVGLHKVDEVSGADPNIVWQKAQVKANLFDSQWSKQDAAMKKATERQRAAKNKEQKKDLAAELTAQAQANWDAVGSLLAATLRVDDAIDWNTLKDRSNFTTPAPSPPAEPKALPPLVLPPEPRSNQPRFLDTPGLFTRLLDLFNSSRRLIRQEALAAEFKMAHSQWRADCERLRAERTKVEAEVEARAQDTRRIYETAVREWQASREFFKQNQAAVNAAIDADRQKYEKCEQSAVEDYCDLVLQRSQYPDFMPNSWELQYVASTKILIIEFDLPNVDALPKLKEVKYVQARDDMEEKEHSASAINAAYDSAIYQIALRTVHEIFEADRAVRAIDAVSFSGCVTRVDPGSGHETRSCIVSLQVKRNEFEAINLAAVDPRACFKNLKGVGSAKLHSLTPVAPLMRLDRNDSRFVDAYAVVSTLDDGENLAMMDWEDFEHLVREVFELEFGQGGAEVRVTRASRDGGIDAVAFDPDPIRGGKIVIQAKRYTRTVGLSAVRDLYGAVMNEGANKGILVSTATYGPDAYAFARDKPLTLLGGGELLHLLQRHGIKARIDLKEARVLQ